MIRMMILYGDINAKKYRKYYRRPGDIFKKYIIESAQSLLIVYSIIMVVSVIAAGVVGTKIGAF